MGFVKPQCFPISLFTDRQSYPLIIGLHLGQLHRTGPIRLIGTVKKPLHAA
jgi:hypothetical protein